MGVQYRQRKRTGVPWLWRLVAGLSLRRPSFIPETFRARFVIHEVAVLYVSLPVLQLSPVSAFLPVLHTDIWLEEAKGQTPSNNNFSWKGGGGAAFKRRGTLLLYVSACILYVRFPMMDYVSAKNASDVTIKQISKMNQTEKHRNISNSTNSCCYNLWLE